LAVLLVRPRGCSTVYLPRLTDNVKETSDAQGCYTAGMPGQIYTPATFLSAAVPSARDMYLLRMRLHRSMLGMKLRSICVKECLVEEIKPPLIVFEFPEVSAVGNLIASDI